MRRAAAALFDNRVLVGTMTILVVGVAVYLSYIAENGLPFVPTYRVAIQVADAGQLIKNADVRIGGARVGQVLAIDPEPATRAYPHPYARLELSLQRSLQPLPTDTHYRLRVASVLGGNYVELIPGHARQGVPDGGTLTISVNPRRSHDLGYVDLDQALQVFGPRTRRGLRGTVAAFGDAVAGRGAQLNDGIVALDALLGPAQRLLATLADPATRTGQFISGLAGTTAAFAPVMPTVDALLSDSAVTLRAMTVPALGTTIDRLPATETLATRVLTRARPVLADAARIVTALRPAAQLLPQASDRLDAVVRAATPVFGRVPRLATELGRASVAIDALARDPAATGVFSAIGSSDLGTLGSSAFLGLGAILQSVSQAQFSCNAAALWVRNFADALTEGDKDGAWLRMLPILDLSQMFQASTPASDLHDNYYPIEDPSQCQAGNEVYAGAQRIGNPPRTARTVDDTAPPPGVLARAQKVGLVP